MTGLSLLDQQRLLLPDHTDEQLVRAIASELIAELGITEPPVDLRFVASMLDIGTVTVDPGLTEAACLLPTSDGFEIRLRASDPPERQRFSTGHECGHTFHSGFELAPQFRCDPTPHQAMSKQELEQLCDIAASELLLPGNLFGPDVRSTDFGRMSVSALADAYHSSLAATGIAFIKQWPEPAAFISMERMHKKHETPGTAEALRLRWATSHGAWPFFCRLKSAATGDPFDRAEQGDIVHEITELSGVVKRPVTVEIHAWRSDYPTELGAQTRVLALARQVERR